MNDERRQKFAAQLAPHVREYCVGYEDVTVTITRYTNHHRTLPDNAWCVMISGPRYLAVDGQWQYKRGSTFATAELALSYLYKWGTPNRAKMIEERGPLPHELEAAYRV